MVCAAQPEEGQWENIDANTRGLTRAVLRFTCQDQILNGEPYPPGPSVAHEPVGLVLAIRLRVG